MARTGAADELGDEGARAVAEMLQVNQTVTEINLGGKFGGGNGEDMWNELLRRKRV